MEKIKKAVVRNKVLSVLVILVVVYAAFSAYSTFGAGKNATPGQLSAKLLPAHPDGAGTEILELTYSAVDPLELTNWWFTNGNGMTHVITPNAIVSGEVLKICADMSADPTCDAEWEGGEMWDDAGGTLSLHSNLGARVIEIGYGAVEAGDSVRGVIEYDDPSKGKGSAVAICHEKGNGTLSQSVIATNNLANGFSRKNGHNSHSTDIIPSFYYDIGEGLTLYSGHNWPDTTGIHERGCTG